MGGVQGGGSVGSGVMGVFCFGFVMLTGKLTDAPECLYILRYMLY
jgi:hypothetical protein